MTATLEVSDWGVRRSDGAQLREAVAWGDVIEISLVTTSQGPFEEDVYFLLHGRDGKGVAVPQELAAGQGLLEQLQQRFAGFDNEAVIEAMGCTDDKRFVLWRAQA